MLPHPPSIRKLLSASLCVALYATLGCGGDATGTDDPDDGIVFEQWPSSIVQAFCIQGTSLVGDTRSGSVTDNDCDSAEIDSDDEGYYEIWRIKVASARDVTFDVSSGFDSFLTVFQVHSVTSSSANVSLVGQNDDRAQGNLDALLTVRLQPGVEYVVAVAGYDYSETGSYTLSIR